MLEPWLWKKSTNLYFSWPQFRSSLVIFCFNIMFANKRERGYTKHCNRLLEHWEALCYDSVRTNLYYICFLFLTSNCQHVFFSSQKFLRYNKFSLTRDKYLTSNIYKNWLVITFRNFHRNGHLLFMRMIIRMLNNEKLCFQILVKPYVEVGDITIYYDL